MGWNPQQQDAIDARGQNLLVSAAAGSGKTAVLTERVAKLAAEGIPLERMLIITFTNAAAAEMKQRISEKVSLSVLTKYNICTFDKFAIEICKSYYQIIDIPPGLKICDQFRQELMRSEVLDEMFEEKFEADDEAFKDFLLHYCSPKSNDAAREMISSLYDFVQSMPEPEEWLKKLSERPFDPEKLFKIASDSAASDVSAAVRLFESAAQLLSGEEGGRPVTSKLAAKNAEDLCAIKWVEELFEGGRLEDAFKALGEIKFQQMRSTKDEAAAYELIKEEVSALRDSGKGILKKLSERLAGLSLSLLEEELEKVRPWAASLCALTEEFAARFSKKKLSAGLMDFSDAEHYALRILKDPEVQSELKEHFDCIFIDEYQDSNYVQEALIGSVCRGNNLFMVGDIKQSIYKFRLAEPEIFLGKYKAFRTGSDPLSRVIDLNRNYRSKGTVIDFINEVFARLMTEKTVGMEYDSAAQLVEGAPYEGEFSYQPELILISKGSEDDDEAGGAIEDLKAEELEALNAVRVIKKYHGCPINVKGKDRQLRYSDMAVLLRSAKSRGEVFYQTLLENGIPVYLERGEGYFDTPEIQVFLNLLRVIDNPRQDVPLLSVMHFPSFGFSASELADIKTGGRKAAAGRSFYETLKAFAFPPDGIQIRIGEGPGLEDKCRDLLEKLSAWRRKGACIPLADFIWELMHESGIALYAQALSGGAQRIANLRAMADMAGSYESETSGGIGGFVSYIEMIAASGKVDTGQVKLLTEADDVVRIMTIHKSKGLEFPFVLLAGMGQRLGGKPNALPIRMHRDLGASLKLSDPKRGLKAAPLSLRIIERVLGSEDYAEDIRVLYVAMTRARDILVMSAALKDAKDILAGRRTEGEDILAGNYLDMILPSVPASRISYVSAEELACALPKSSERELVRLGIEQGFDVDEGKLPLPIKELEERLLYAPAAAPEAELKRKYSVSEIAELSRMSGGASEELPRPKKQQGALSGAEKGTAYHSVMEHIPFTAEGKSAEDIAEFIAGLLEKHILSEAQAAAVDPERIAAFFRSDIGKRVLAAKEVRKEAPFVMQTELNGRQVLVQGVIDCYFREGDSYVLVDYKSNYVDRRDPSGSREKLRAHYEPQLALYKEALEGISGVKVKECVLYLFGLDDGINIF